jgi:hypothetical protein
MHQLAEQSMQKSSAQLDQELEFVLRWQAREKYGRPFRHLPA